MVKINLLPVKQKQRQVTVVTQLIVGGVLILALGLLMLGHFATMKIRQGKLNNEITQLRADIKNLDRLIGQVEDLEAKSAELERKLDTIAQLKRNKSGPVKMLEELSVTVPKKLWLTSLKETTTSPKSKSVVLTGNATTQEVIADFMSRLEESQYFQQVNLVRIRLNENQKGGFQSQEFEITANLIFRDENDTSTQAMATP